MSTTVLVDETTRDDLARSRDAMGATSMDEAIRRLMRDATPTAKELWQKRKKHVLKVCKEFDVTRLIAFGSRVRDDRHPGSDLDLVVEFPVDQGMRGFFDLRDKLTEAFGVTVDMGSVPPDDTRLWGHIIEEGIAFVGPQP